MAQGSTGFSKQEIDALMEAIHESWTVSLMEGPVLHAYLKLKGVQDRLQSVEDWKKAGGWA